MELIPDVKTEIVFYLDKKISTLISKEIRHIYFQKNGILLRYFCSQDISARYDLLRKYRIKLVMDGRPMRFNFGPRIKTGQLFLDKVFDQIIMNNIKTIRLTPLFSKNLMGLEDLKRLSRIKTHYNIDDIEGIVYLSKIKAKKPLMLIVTDGILPDHVAVLSGLNLVIDHRETFYIPIFQDPRPILTDKITKMSAMSPLAEDYPNLKTLIIKPEDLIRTTKDYPKLKRVYYDEISKTSLDPRLQKYSNIAKYRKTAKFVPWSGIEYELYQRIRPYIFGISCHIKIEYLEMLVILEEEYKKTTHILREKQ